MAEIVEISDEHRFWARVIPGERGCLTWDGWTNDGGYGIFYLSKRGIRNIRAHRWSYNWAKGPIPDGLTIDHLCRNHLCVNPDHLEAVTRRENTLRGTGLTAQLSRKTHCPYGHPYDLLNTRFKQGRRRCAICWRRRQKENRARARARKRAMAAVRT